MAGTPASTLAGVPWSKVGPGWELAEYTTGRPPGETAGGAVKAYQVTLYLISPAGVRYPMRTWAADATVPYLIAWSGDKTRALLGLTGSKYEQLTLATGKLTAGQLPGRAQPDGYTLPDGLNILGVAEGSTSTAPSTIARYSLAGRLLKVLTRGVNESTAVYAANGTVLAVSGSKGLELVSNVGGVIRSLPVPGTDSRGRLHPGPVVELNHGPRRVLRQRLQCPSAVAGADQRQAPDRAHPAAQRGQPGPRRHRRLAARLGDLPAGARGVRDPADLPAGRRRVHHPGSARAHDRPGQPDRDRARRPAAARRADRLPRQ